MSEPLNLDAVRPDDDLGYDSDDVKDLIAEVRKLREIVLADHQPGELGVQCQRCVMLGWPCPSAQAAGAT